MLGIFVIQFSQLCISFDKIRQLELQTTCNRWRFSIFITKKIVRPHGRQTANYQAKIQPISFKYFKQYQKYIQFCQQQNKLFEWSIQFIYQILVFVQLKDIIIEQMQFLQSFDFLTGVNPGLKIFVYVLIVIHLLAVTAWCAYACPTMFKQEQSFADKVQKQLKSKKTN